MADTLVPCSSLETRSLMWAINSADEVVVLNSTEVQPYYDQKYNISHEINYKGDVCPY